MWMEHVNPVEKNMNILNVLLRNVQNIEMEWLYYKGLCKCHPECSLWYGGSDNGSTKCQTGFDLVKPRWKVCNLTQLYQECEDQ